VRAGFSLVEILAVLVIMGLLAAMATVAILPPRQDSRVRVAADLRRARAEALQSRRPVVWRRDQAAVRFLPDGSSGGVTISVDGNRFDIDRLTGVIR
jgi:type II secretion system protein H